MKQKSFTLSINESDFKVVDPKIVAEANKRIRKVMIPLIRDFKRKSKMSEIRAREIIVL